MSDTELHIPKRFVGEQEALNLVARVGAQWGYGNCIQFLKEKWKEDLIKSGLTKEAAELAVKNH